VVWPGFLADASSSSSRTMRSGGSRRQTSSATSFAISLRTQALSQVKRAAGLSADAAEVSGTMRPGDLLGILMISTPESPRGRGRDRRDWRRDMAFGGQFGMPARWRFYSLLHPLQGWQRVCQPPNSDLTVVLTFLAALGVLRLRRIARRRAGIVGERVAGSRPGRVV
jgi:hypothetical protein